MTTFSPCLAANGRMGSMSAGQPCRGVDVHEHRRGPCSGYGPGGGEEGERGGDHLVPRSDPAS